MGVKHNRKHGERTSSGGSPEYRSWMAMNARCRNKKLKDWKNYGGRGITVCERWHNFSNFLEDVGRRPSLFHSLDRIDVNKGYFKDNCRWATATEQNNNRRNNTIIEIGGIRKTQAEWCKHFKIKKETVRTRLKNGWTIVNAFSFPVRKKSPTKEVR